MRFKKRLVLKPRAGTKIYAMEIKVGQGKRRA